MAPPKFHKVVGSLPSQLEADAFYAVRTGEGFDLYLSDMTGTMAHRLNMGAAPEPEIIPQRIKTATSETLVLAGHSSLFEANPGEALVNNWPGQVYTQFYSGYSSEVWDANGAPRTEPAYDVLIISELDEWNTTQQYAHPATPRGMSNLQHQYWFGRAAQQRGAELVLFWSPVIRDSGQHEHNQLVINYYRWWLEHHLGQPVWVIPADRYVQELANDLPLSDIYEEDGIHLRQAARRGVYYLTWAFLTGSLPTVVSGEEFYANAAMRALEGYRWAGFGSPDRAAMLDIADPLPSPLPLPGGEPDPDFARTASTVGTRHMHSGHSLTDAYMRPDHEDQLRRIRQSIFDVATGWDDVHYQSTIPGSPSWWRWGDGAPPTIARTGIADFDSLVITEGGPPPLVTEFNGLGALQSLLGLLKFADNTWRNGNGGAGAETIFWSIWPSTTLDWQAHYPQFANFRDFLVSYETRFRWRADWVEWKMRQIHPELPEDYRIWIIPGHRMILRIYDDLQAGGIVPQFTSMDDALEPFAENGDPDGIHASMPMGYGLACLVATMLYQVDLRTVPGVFVQTHGSDPARNVTPELAEYFHRIAWEICTTYEPCGMGGTDQGLPGWDPVDDHDYFPMIETVADLETVSHEEGHVTPEEPGGGDPGDGGVEGAALVWTPQTYTGPTPISGTQPSNEGTHLLFSGTEPSIFLNLPFGAEKYGIVAMRVIGSAGAVSPLITWQTNGNPDNWHSGYNDHLGYNGYVNNVNMSGEGNWDGPGRSVNQGNLVVFEFGRSADSLYIRNVLNDSADQVAAIAAGSPTANLRIFGRQDNGGAMPSIEVFGLALFDGTPTEQQRSDARAWALDRLPG